LAEKESFAQFGMKRRIKGSTVMKSTLVAAAFALAGAGFILPTAVAAAVVAPGQGAMRDQAGSAIIKIQRTINRPVQRAVPTRRIAPQRAIRPNRVAPNRVVRPNRAVGPRTVGPRTINRGIAPGRAAVVHRRGFRPAGYRRWHPQHLVVRRWYHRPYYGRIIGGIAIGTLLAASAYYVYAAEPPAPGLCWFWADPDETQGYWDYCVDPQ
jgi:hypothetical protein